MRLKRQRLPHLVVASVVALAGSVHTFGVGHPEVVVDPVHRSASGSFAGAAYSDDSTQYIACRIQSVSPSASAYMACEARDVDGQRLSCVSSEPAHVAMLVAMDDYDHVSFEAEMDANGVSRCTRLETATFSRHRPG